MQENHTDNFIGDTGFGASSGNVIFSQSAYAVVIMCPNHTSSDDPCGGQSPESDDLSGLQTAARRLIDAIAAEPVPERLRELAIELNKALARQQEKGMAGDPAAPR